MNRIEPESFKRFHSADDGCHLVNSGTYCYLADISDVDIQLQDHFTSANEIAARKWNLRLLKNAVVAQ